MRCARNSSVYIHFEHHIIFAEIVVSSCFKRDPLAFFRPLEYLDAVLCLHVQHEVQGVAEGQLAGAAEQGHAGRVVGLH